MNSQLSNNSTIQDTLNEAANQLQNRFIREEGSTYSIEDLERALSNWLELSVESLLDDVLFHVVEGDRAYAFNRRAFELEMLRLQPVQSSYASLTASESESELVSQSSVSQPTDSQVAA